MRYPFERTEHRMKVCGCGGYFTDDNPWFGWVCGGCALRNRKSNHADGWTAGASGKVLVLSGVVAGLPAQVRVSGCVDSRGNNSATLHGPGAAGS